VTQPEYDRGVAAGQVLERLSGHDQHFEKINGSLEKVAANLSDLNLGIQRLVDSAAADRATVLTTAKALKDADDARRDKGEQRWSPVQKLIAVTSGLAAAAVVVAEVLAHVH
jgi:hypothetical protein